MVGRWSKITRYFDCVHRLTHCHVSQPSHGARYQVYGWFAPEGGFKKYSFRIYGTPLAEF